MIKIAGLWAKTSKKGNRYMAGRINAGSKVLLLKNERRQGDNDPEWLLFITDGEKQAEGQGQTQQGGYQNGQTKQGGYQTGQGGYSGGDKYQKQQTYHAKEQAVLTSTEQGEILDDDDTPF